MTRARTRVLVTGMEGFAGSHLADWLVAQGRQVHGTVFPGASLRNLTGIPEAHAHPLDVTDAGKVWKLIRQVRPARIYHLAGQSNPAVSKLAPEATLRTNVLGTLNVLEAALALNVRPRVLVVGSADEYGRTPASLARVPETRPVRPESPYGDSKVCQDLLAEWFNRRHGLHVVRVRPFNHIGPRQAVGFVAADFASQIAAIECRKKAPVMEVGNLDVIRDFSDVRDIAAGYGALLEKGAPGQVYNLGSGRGRRVRDLLDGLLALSTARITVRVRPGRVRAEHARKVASIARACRDTGWKPRVPWAQTLRDILDDWRSRTA